MGLEPRIFRKGRAGLFRLGQAEFAGRDQLQPEGLEQLLEFLELAFIVGGQDQSVTFAEARDRGHWSVWPPGMVSELSSLALAPSAQGREERSSARLISFQM